jgi:hypothetical protein
MTTTWCHELMALTTSMAVSMPRIHRFRSWLRYSRLQSLVATAVLGSLVTSLGSSRGLMFGFFNDQPSPLGLILPPVLCGAGIFMVSEPLGGHGAARFAARRIDTYRALFIAAALVVASAIMWLTAHDHQGWGRSTAVCNLLLGFAVAALGGLGRVSARAGAGAIVALTVCIQFGRTADGSRWWALLVAQDDVPYRALVAITCAVAAVSVVSATERLRLPVPPRRRAFALLRVRAGVVLWTVVAVTAFFMLPVFVQLSNGLAPPSASEDRTAVLAVRASVVAWVTATEGERSQPLPVGELGTPDHRLGASEMSHLADVRDRLSLLRQIWLSAAVLGAAAVGACCLPVDAGRRRSLVAATLAGAAALSLGLGMAVALRAAIGFDTAFHDLHRLLFRSGTWTFPDQSLLGETLPSAYWQALGVRWAVVTAVIVVAYSIVALGLGVAGGRSASRTIGRPGDGCSSRRPSSLRRRPRPTAGFGTRPRARRGVGPSP